MFESSDGVPGWVDTDTLLRAEPCEPCGPHAGFAGGGSIFVLTECAFSLKSLEVLTQTHPEFRTMS